MNKHDDKGLEQDGLNGVQSARGSAHVEYSVNVVFAFNEFDYK